MTASQMEGRVDTRSESLRANCGVTLLYTHKELQEEQFEEKPGPDHDEHKGNGCTLVSLVSTQMYARHGKKVLSFLMFSNIPISLEEIYLSIYNIKIYKSDLQVLE